MALVLAAASSAKARSFEAEGADTGAGLGARYVAQGGTGIASSDDVYAIYYNPAGLINVKAFELAVSSQLNATLHRINFFGGAWRLPFEDRWGVKATVAVSYYPRIHARASGAYQESDFESLFLRYLLPGISGTFDGDIDTKTKSYRLALGLAPQGDSPWSAGLYLERIDCKSNFCGVHATSNGFTTSSTGATALGAGWGVRYQASPRLTLAGSVSDLHTRLTVNSVTTDNAGTRVQQFQAAFPRKMAAAAAWQVSTRLTFAADYEMTKGRYGSSSIDLHVLRLGTEKQIGPWKVRVGAVVPLRIYSSKSGTLNAPFPLAPTAGLGWKGGPVEIDFALYAHNVMSMHKHAISPAADLSLLLSF